MRGSFGIGRIFGIPITINPSWFLILIAVVTTLATQAFPAQLGAQPWWVYWLLALITAAVIFFSMVLHELGHSVVARYFDIPVRSITLFVLGAVAQTARESRRPGHEFLMAVAGPAVSILVAGVFMVLWFLTGSGAGTLSRVFGWLWIINVWVGLFNMAPAFPMDGGRVLRSALWGMLGSYRRATRLAALVGRGFAYLLIGAGVLVALRAPGPFHGFSPFSGVQFVLLGLFLNYAARQGDLQSGVLDYLSGYRAGDVMVRDVPTALAGDSVREALLGPLSGYGAAREWLFVSDGERCVGLAPRGALQALPEEQWDGTAVAATVIPAASLRAAAPDEPLSEVLQRMEADQVPVVVVVDGGQVAGIIHRGLIAGLLHGRQEAAGG